MDISLLLDKLKNCKNLSDKEFEFLKELLNNKFEITLEDNEFVVLKENKLIAKRDFDVLPNTSIKIGKIISNKDLVVISSYHFSNFYIPKGKIIDLELINLTDNYIFSFKKDEIIAVFLEPATNQFF